MHFLQLSRTLSCLTACFTLALSEPAFISATEASESLPGILSTEEAAGGAQAENITDPDSIPSPDTEEPQRIFSDTDSDSSAGTGSDGLPESGNIVRNPEKIEDTVLPSFSVADSYEMVTDGEMKDGYYIKKVSAQDIENNGVNNAIQSALDDAYVYASAAIPYKIYIEPGTYTLTRGLRIYSNTFLFMDQVTFVQKKDITANMLKVGNHNDTQNGYFYQNITLYGGVWDENGNSNTAVKVGHCAGFSMIGQTVQNTANSHLMEVAGVKDFLLSDCTFQDQTLDKNSERMTYEAVQLDLLIPDHIKGYAYEVLANDGITVDSCTFRNVPRGIGSHTSILNCPMTNIRITNNTFSDMTSAAIHGCNFTSCTISGNTITNTPRGIAIYSVRNNGTFLASTVASSGNVLTNISGSYNTPAADQKIKITGNSISCRGKDQYMPYEKTGILVRGFIHNGSYTPQDGDYVPTGDYYLSGVTITGNTITTECDGIMAYNVRNAVISQNPEIRYTGDASKNHNGISLLDHCSDITVTGNQLSGMPGSGILLQSSAATAVSDNTISASRYGGIYVYNNSSVAAIENNTLTDVCKDTPLGAISIGRSGSTASIQKNRIVSPGSFGVLVIGGTADAIDKNNIEKPANYGILLTENASVTSIRENRITSGSAMGITVAGSASAVQIAANTIQQCKTAQIYVNQDTSLKTVTISGNSLTGEGDAAGIRADSGRAVITGNTITGCQYAMHVSSGATTAINPNLCSNNKMNGVQIDSISCINPDRPSSLTAKADGNDKIQLSWEKTDGADGYRVYRSETEDGVYQKIGSVSADKTSCTSTNLKADTKYYYKIAAYKKSANKKTVVLSGYSKTISETTAKQ